MQEPDDIKRRKTAVAFVVLGLAISAILAGGLACREAYLHEGTWWEIGTALRRVAEFFTTPVRMMWGHSPSLPALIITTTIFGFIYSAAITGFSVWLGEKFSPAVPAPREEVAKQAEVADSSEPTETKISRRTLLKSAAWGAPAVLVGTPAWSAGVSPQCLKLRRYQIAIRDLPQALDGALIAHLSDLHFSRWIGPDHIRRALKMAVAEKPDVVLFTGDYVSSDPAGFQRVAELIADEMQDMNILATLGNHDHWTDPALAREVLPKAGLELIDNRRMFFSREGLSSEPLKQAICIGGIGDLWEDATDFDAATEGASAQTPRIILSHNPDAAEEYTSGNRAGRRPPRIDLMLAGHTHGGQVYIPGLGTPIVPSNFGSKYAGGLVQGPHWPVIISRGVGMAVLPVRFLCPPEVVIIELVKGSKSE